MNPHGTCFDCLWSTHHLETDLSGDWDVWRCWKDPGCPIVRLSTVRLGIEPPACECHLKEKQPYAHICP